MVQLRNSIRVLEGNFWKKYVQQKVRAKNPDFSGLEIESQLKNSKSPELPIKRPQMG